MVKMSFQTYPRGVEGNSPSRSTYARAVFQTYPRGVEGSAEGSEMSDGDGVSDVPSWG